MADWRDDFKIVGIFTVVCLIIILLGAMPLHQALKRMHTASFEAEALRVREAALQRAAEQGADAKAQFLAIVSHEMRTPLHGMLGFSDLLLEGELIDAQRELAMEIHGAAELLLNLLNDVLIIVKLQRGQGVIEFSAMDIQILMRTIVDAHSKRALEKGIALAEDIDAGIPPLVWGAGAEIRLVLDKLIDNAIKFSSGGTVTLGAVMHKVDGAPELCTMEFFVSDQGIGIDQTHLDLIFQPFTQADSAIGRRFNGLGLGLNICKSLVERLGGELAVDSVPGTGSRFCVKIPLSLVYVPSGSVTPS
jgi:signal transduction histidine kinase